MTVKHAASENSTTEIFNIGPDAIQPNGVDLRLKKVFKILPNVFEIDAENNKKHRGVEEILPDENGFWFLEPGEYEVTCMETVKVGQDEMGLIVTRSSINRNSCYLFSCVFDSGYSGECAMRFQVNVAPIKIQRGTRIAQYVTYTAESAHQYHGSYGFGTADDAKYGTGA